MVVTPWVAVKEVPRHRSMVPVEASDDGSGGARLTALRMVLRTATSEVRCHACLESSQMAASQEELAWRVLLGPSANIGRVSVGDTEVFVARAGRGDCPLVFIGGLGESSLTWAGLAPRLAAANDVVVYDRPGLGQSPPSARPRTVERQVSELSGLLAALHVDRAVLIGHSLGARIAAETARSCPDQVAGAVLIDPVDPTNLKKRGPVALQRVLLALPQALSLVGLWPRVSRATASKEAGSAASDPSVQDALAAALVEVRTTSSSRRTAADEFAGLRSSAKRVAAWSSRRPIPVPFTVLSAATSGAGEKARRTWTASNDALAAASDRGRHVVVAGSSHCVHTSHPDVVIEEIRALQERL